MHYLLRRNCSQISFKRKEKKGGGRVIDIPFGLLKTQTNRAGGLGNPSTFLP